jgi:hypothetical protein
MNKGCKIASISFSVKKFISIAEAWIWRLSKGSLNSRKAYAKWGGVEFLRHRKNTTMMEEIFRKIFFIRANASVWD